MSRARPSPPAAVLWITRTLEEAGFERVTQHPMTFGVCIAYLGFR